VTEQVTRVVQAFRIPGVLTETTRWGSGHIHDTYRVTSTVPGGESRRTLLQRINLRVFADPTTLLETIRRTTAHLRAKAAAQGVADLDRRVLRLLETADRDVGHRDADGSWWRAYAFVDDACTFDTATSPRLASEAARAFGSFQRDLADFPAADLGETIPRFHDTPARFAALRSAIEADAADRVGGAGPEIEFAALRATMAPVLRDAHEAGRIPKRIAHNDTKINNLLFDTATSEALCVIDLDTVMPGLGLYDFGDLVRTCTCAAPEDERDLRRVYARPEFFSALVGGYLNAMGDLLAPGERELLTFAGRLVTLEIGVRFLTDHLQGDPYFGARRPGHNLDRCRMQFALLRSLEAQEDDFAAMVRAT